MTKLDYSDKALGLRPDTAQSHRSSSPSPAPAAVVELVARLGAIRAASPLLVGDVITALSTLAADKARIEADRDRHQLRADVCLNQRDKMAELKEAAEARASALEQALTSLIWLPGVRKILDTLPPNDLARAVILGPEDQQSCVPLNIPTLGHL